jgi:nucleotide-binding universal stress UspA family protein
MSLTILVPLDGSPLAERALPYALDLARGGRGRVALIRATWAYTAPGDDAVAAQRQARLTAEADLSGVAVRVQAEGIPVDTRVYDAEAADAILRAAEAEHARVIVMSTHGRSGVGRWIYGSVADAVLRRSPVPVLLVPSTCERPWAVNTTPLRVLVPLDGSELAEAAVGPAGELMGPGGATLLLLQAVEPVLPIAADGMSYAHPFDEEAELAAARTYLEGVAAQARAKGWTTEVEAVIGYPASSIAAVAREQAVDVVAMATHGRGGMARLVLGSVATGVLQRAHVPVLVVPPAAVQPAAAARTPTSQAEEPLVTLTLTARELEWVQRGLDELLHSAMREVGGRVDEAEGTAAIAALARRVSQTPSRPKSMLVV